MVVAGAGGHALEVLDVLVEMGYREDDIIFLITLAWLTLRFTTNFRC